MTGIAAVVVCTSLLLRALLLRHLAAVVHAVMQQTPAEHGEDHYR
jgi:hypothetical protein